MMLIELVFVIAIISVLASLSVSSYQHSLLKSRRLDAIAALQTQMLALNQCYLVNRDYRQCVPQGMSTLDSEHRFYELRIQTLQQHAYRLVAVPIGPQSKDRICGRLLIDDRNHKTMTGTGTLAQCWP